VRTATLCLLALVITVVAVLGFRGQPFREPPFRPFDDMVEQPRYNAQSESRFFADGRTQRTPPAGTVPWGKDARGPDARFAGADEPRFALEAIPVPIDRPLLLEGRRLFGVYCAVCHGGTGDGHGITTRLGMINPTSYHDERLRNMKAGEIYEVITKGKGQMGPYAGKLPRPEQRWAVVAWVRVLQRAFHATLDDVPEAARKELAK